MQHPVTEDIMAKDQFEQPKRHVHFADDSNADNGRKLYKIEIQSVLYCSKANFQVMYKPEMELRIVESMVPFRGPASGQ
uniref:DDE_Tnp_1_7 domain-containing protein n=1 Tax=Haemonchus placei TaxID=6290 RepID=A0A0N4WUX5_HAEPC